MPTLNIATLFQNVVTTLHLLGYAAQCQGGNSASQQFAKAIKALSGVSARDIKSLANQIPPHIVKPTGHKGIRAGGQKWVILSLLDDPTRENDYIAPSTIAAALAIRDKQARDTLSRLAESGFVNRKKDAGGKVVYNITPLGREELLRIAVKSLFSAPEKCAVPQAEKNAATNFVLPEGFVFSATIKEKMHFDNQPSVMPATAKAEILMLLELAKRHVTGTDRDFALPLSEMRAHLPWRAGSLCGFVSQLSKLKYDGAPVIEAGSQRGYWKITNAGSAALHAAGFPPTPA